MKDQLSSEWPAGAESSLLAESATAIAIANPLLTADTTAPTLLKETTNLAPVIKVKQPLPPAVQSADSSYSSTGENGQEVSQVETPGEKRQLNGCKVEAAADFAVNNNGHELDGSAPKAKKAKLSLKSPFKVPSKSKTKKAHKSSILASVLASTSTSASTAISTGETLIKKKTSLDKSTDAADITSETAEKPKKKRRRKKKVNEGAETETEQTEKPQKKPGKRGRPPTKADSATAASKPAKQRKRKKKSATSKETPPEAAASVAQQRMIPLVIPRHRIIGPVVRISRQSDANSQLDDEPEPAHRTERMNLPFKYTLLNRQLLVDSKGNPVATDDQTSSSASATPKVSHYARMMAEVKTTTTDKWFCFFCHKGPHVERLGDLYGPYIVDMVPEPDADRELMPPPQDRCKPTQSKKKMRHSVSLAPPGPPLPQRHELWFHEDCIVWTPNVYLDTLGKLVNIEEAVKEARTTLCVFCRRPGATLGCINKACYFRALHFPCARQIGCYFDEPRFSLFCEGHYDLLQLDPDRCQQFFPQKFLQY